MSDKRKVLKAKRKNERENSLQRRYSKEVYMNEKSLQHGTKRSNTAIETPIKNLANDRLIRLRTSLQEDAKTKFKDFNNAATSNFQSKKGHIKKRLSNSLEIIHKAKISKLESNTVSKIESVENSCSGCTETDTRVSNGTTEPMEWSLISDDKLSERQNPVSVNDEKLKSDFMIIVDTNILLSHLQLIEDILTLKMTDNIKPVIFIPWTVNEELDFLKEDSKKSHIRFKAQAAIKYINKLLSQKHRQILGQTAMDASNQFNILGNSQDNKIISCCLQIQQKCENMILLTNDINLRNKALFNGITVCAHNEIISKISSLGSLKAENILNKMLFLCTNVQRECLKKAYGVAFEKMPVCQTPPETLEDCIKVFKKYWFPVFREILMKQFQNALEDLSNILLQIKGISDNNSDINILLKHCFRVCCFLRDANCCPDLVQNTVEDLKSFTIGHS